MRQLFYYKLLQTLLKNAPAFLLQNATDILQKVTVTTKCNDFITKCDVYYKMRQ